jgi:hypothetical protein
MPKRTTPFVFCDSDGCFSKTSCCKAVTELLGSFLTCKYCGHEVEMKDAPPGVRILDVDPETIVKLLATSSKTPKRKRAV